MNNIEKVKLGLEFCIVKCGDKCPYYREEACFTKLKKDALEVINLLDKGDMSELADYAIDQKREARSKTVQKIRDAISGGVDISAALDEALN